MIITTKLTVIATAEGERREGGREERGRERGDVSTILSWLDGTALIAYQ